MTLSNALNGLRSALMFITIIPAGKNAPWAPMEMIRFFPVVGLIIGAALVCTDGLVSGLWNPVTASLLDVVFLMAVTGAFHLDGLGDTADGMFSHRPKERVLEIMKDSRVGMMGLVVVVSVLAMKVAGIYSAKAVLSPGQTMILLFIVPAYARASMIFGIRFLDYGRKGTGTGLDLFSRPIGVKDFIYGLIPLFFSLFLGYKCLVLNLAFLAALVVILKFYQKKMGCITGDMLGAMNEIMEAVLFLAAGTQF